MQIFYSLSERHSLLEDGETVDGAILSEALSLVVEHAAHLPRLHNEQASCRDTAMLVVGPCLASCPLGSRATCMGVCPTLICCQDARGRLHIWIQGMPALNHQLCMAGVVSMSGVCEWQAPSMAMMLTTALGFTTKAGREKLHALMSDAPFRTLCAEALSGLADGRLLGNLGDTPEALETGENIPVRSTFGREELRRRSVLRAASALT